MRCLNTERGLKGILLQLEFNSLVSHFVDVYETAKADRVAAIRATAAALRERLNMESKRLNELVHSKKQLTIESSFHQQIDVDDQHQTYQYPGKMLNIKTPCFHYFILSALIPIRQRQ